MTGDCRYNVPKGLLVVPDVSCVTSFTSKVIKNTFELQKSLSVSVSASGGFGAFSFSASAGYKQASSEVSSGEKVYITSSAKCSYYYSNIDLTQPPPLHPGFYSWAKALEKNHSEANLLKFVKYYGTHFPTSVVFGARFLKQHSMSSKSYKTAFSSDISVSAQASYSGLVSVSGGFSLDKRQREAASNFSKEVETTTVTVGAAPPSNGDATYWASTVKENPVPIFYKIEPISNLFTSVFMKGKNINYNFLRKKLVDIEKKYCQHLFRAGTVDNCRESLFVDITINNWYLKDSISMSSDPETTCISQCTEDRHCFAMSHIPNTNECYLYDNLIHDVADHEVSKAKTIIFPTKLYDGKTDFVVQNLRVSTQSRPQSTTVPDHQSCKKVCLQDNFCDIFIFCSDKNNCKSQVNNCRLYSSKTSKTSIKFRRADEKYKMFAYFISRF